MPQFQRHIGSLSNTGSHLVVVFMQLPDDPYHALVVENDSLPPKYQDPLQDLLTSNVAQNEKELSNVLNRNSFPDGRNMLSALHQDGYLQKVHISKVILRPFPSQNIPLTQVLSEMNKLPSDIPVMPQNYHDKHSENVNQHGRNEIGEATNQGRELHEAMKSSMDTPKTATTTSTLDPVAEQATQDQVQQAQDTQEDPTQLAQSKLWQAQMLEQDVNKLKEEAYELDPSLKPKKSPGRPKKNSSQKKTGTDNKEASQ